MPKHLQERFVFPGTEAILEWLETVPVEDLREWRRFADAHLTEQLARGPQPVQEAFHKLACEGRWPMALLHVRLAIAVRYMNHVTESLRKGETREGQSR